MKVLNFQVKKIVICLNSSALQKLSKASISTNVYVKSKSSNYYRDPEVFKQEYQKLFYPSWQYFCSVSQLPEPGNYVSKLFLNLPIFAIRGKDKSIKVFHNVCSHRGSLLLPQEDCSKIDVLRCGYHGWCFNHSGNLVSAPYFDKKEFDYSKMSLKSIDFTIFHDQVFICMKNPQPADLFFQLQTLDKELKDVEFEKNYVYAKEFVYPVNNFNWKLIIENNLETSHVEFVHQASLVSYWDNVKHDHMDFQIYEDRNLYQNQLFHKGKSLDGHWYYFLPNQIFNSYEGYCSWERHYPVDINTCQSHFTVFVNKNSELYKKNDNDAAKTADVLMNLSHGANEEDFENCRRQQKNMETGIFDTGYIQGHWDAGTAFFEKFYIKK